MNDVRKIIESCCSACKATQPFERLSIDFKGSLLSNSPQRYLFNGCRRIFAFSSRLSLLQCQCTICDRVFDAIVCAVWYAGSCLVCRPMFGMPAYIHSDKGFCFSFARTDHVFLHDRGVACSRTSAYSASGNGQCERYNGIIWFAVKLALKSRYLDIARWLTVLADALHSVRSLCCHATNETPQERFFQLRRNSTFGISVPTWLSTPGPV